MGWWGSQWPFVTTTELGAWSSLRNQYLVFTYLPPALGTGGHKSLSSLLQAGEQNSRVERRA
ncbi:hypothetical protein I79_025682 [Cricetulus griseus]|uniref:Uncharacterized protein n=1 Tax=Cricetulus griseus TaxID=10029 RepID=G3INY4_CRIGR|nr:hypothetical protein I79_025682 [Cricetulus griseus]